MEEIEPTSYFVLHVKNPLLWTNRDHTSCDAYCRSTGSAGTEKGDSGRHTSPPMGRDSSVGIATRYGLNGPGIESRWGRNFPHPSRPALGPTQPPVQWVPGLSRG